MAICNSLLIFLSFLLIFLLQVPICLSQNPGNKHFTVIKVDSILPTACSTSTSITGATNRHSLKIKHRHGPCSQSSQANQFHEQVLLQDQARVDSIQYLLSNNSSQAEILGKKTRIPATPGTALGTGNYIVQVGFGNPVKTMSVIFDTGSDLTWIQCEPCVRYCHDQKDPKFDPSKSTSYTNISCNSDQCSQLKSGTGNTPGCDASSTCIYGIQYGDSSFSVGYFAQDFLTITSTAVFPSFLFGCGQNNRGLFGGAAGLLGLGRDKLSLVSQTLPRYGGVFSYCLPRKSSSSGYLSFGSEQSASTRFTPMITDPRNPSFYFLDITAIIVGDTKVPISASSFGGGSLIDSGTVITRLPPSVYTAMKSAFENYMTSYPKAPAISILDTCYNFTGFDNVTVPNIVFVFQGNVNVKVDFAGVLIGTSQSQICLAFAGNSDSSAAAIFGNLQQQKLKVVYDVPNKKIGFGPGDC